MEAKWKTIQSWRRQPSPDLAVHVVLGSPRNACRNIGICRIERHDSNQGMTNHPAGRVACQSAMALLSTLRPGQLMFYFVRRSLSNCVYQGHFSEGWFRMEDDYHLAPFLLEALGLRPGATLPAGQYPVVSLKSHLSIEIPLVTPKGLTIVPTGGYPYQELPAARAAL